MTNARQQNHRQRGKYGTQPATKLPLDESGAVNKAALVSAPEPDYRPMALRHRPVHRKSTPEMTMEARLSRGSATASYTIGSEAGPAVITRDEWTAVTTAEMARIADVHVDKTTFYDGAQRVQRRVRKIEFRNRETGEPVELAPIEDEILPALATG